MALLIRYSLLIACLLLVFHHSPVRSSEEGALRLFNVEEGTNGDQNHGYDYQGVLQIFHVGAWGSICAEGWAFKEAEVACRQLGYSGASLSAAPFNLMDPNGDVWLSEVNCSGNEESIVECKHSDWGVVRSRCLNGPGLVKIQCRVSNYLGCVDVEGDSPPLKGKFVETGTLSVLSCIQNCRADGFMLAGVRAPISCVCGTYGEKLAFEGGDHLNKCNATCPGDDKQICGGVSSASIYDVTQGTCGGKATGTNISIASPGFPGLYTAGYRCRWEAHVTGSSYTTIRLPVLSLAPNDELLINIHGETIPLRNEDSFEARVVEHLSKVIVTFTSSATSQGAGGFMLTLTDDSYCPSVSIVNGSLGIVDDMMYRPGDSVEVLCEHGFMPYRKVTTCSKDGMWHPEPKCLVYNKWTSWEFRRTVLFIAVIAVCVLFLMFMLTICYLLCGDTKKKNEGRYYGINTDSGEAHAHDGGTTPSKEEYKAVGMEDAGDIDEEGREAHIPLASEADV